MEIPSECGKIPSAFNPLFDFCQKSVSDTGDKLRAFGV